MAVVTLEDLAGSVDVVIFPRTYADAGVATKLTDDAVLLVAGRVDHKGDETVVLADAHLDLGRSDLEGRGAVRPGGRRPEIEGGAVVDEEMAMAMAMARTGQGRTATGPRWARGAHR